MAIGATIKFKRKAGAFTGGELAAGELGVDTTNMAVYASMDGTTVEALIAASDPIGEIVAHAGFALPNGFLWCQGQTVSIASYKELAAVIGGGFGYSNAFGWTASFGSGFTIIGTSSAHGLAVGDIILGEIALWQSTVSLPPGLSTLQQVPLFIVEVPSSTSFRVSDTAGGSPIMLTNTQAGKVVYQSFALPDLRGRFLAGRDNLGGSAANRLDSLTNDGELLGETGGADVHTLSIGEIPAHTHNYSRRSIDTTVTSGGSSRPASALETQATTSAGGGGSHNNLPPLQVVNYIIRAF